MVVTIAAMMGTGMVTQMLEYAPTLNAKHLAWIAHSTLMGAVLAPMALLGGPVMMRAMWYVISLLISLNSHKN